MNLVEGGKIWDMSRITDRDKTRMELTDLIRFKGYWYCGFREGYIHHNHPSGRARIIRSPDGEKWDSVKLLEWDGADMREPKFSITAEGKLMANTSVAFVSAEPRPDGYKHAFNVYDRKSEAGQYGRHYWLDNLNIPQNDFEKNVARQSATWISSDGEDWGDAYACPSGINTWRWEVSWNNGMGYSVGYGGKDKNGTLYRTRDGKNWRVLLDGFFPDGQGNEASLSFGPDSTAYCLLRDGRTRTQTGKGNKDLIRHSDGHFIESGQGDKIHGGSVPVLGIGKAPYYKEWEWKNLSVDWNRDGRIRPVDEVFRAGFGGPKMIRLASGRFVAAGRVLGPGRDDGHITLFSVDTEKGLLTLLAELNGSSYSGIAENDGMLWASYSAEDMPGFMAIYLAKVELPE